MLREVPTHQRESNRPPGSTPRSADGHPPTRPRARGRARAPRAGVPVACAQLRRVHGSQASSTGHHPDCRAHGKARRSARRSRSRAPSRREPPGPHRRRARRAPPMTAITASPTNFSTVPPCRPSMPCTTWKYRHVTRRSSSRSPSAVESVTLVKKTVRPCAPRTRRRRSRGSRHSGHRTVPPSATRRHKAPF